MYKEYIYSVCSTSEEHTEKMGLSGGWCEYVGQGVERLGESKNTLNHTFSSRDWCQLTQTYVSRSKKEGDASQSLQRWGSETTDKGVPEQGY